MAALTPTYVLGSRGQSTELSGDHKIQVYTVVPSTSSDTIVLTQAADQIGTIIGVFAQIVSGSDSALLACEAAFSGLTITLRTFDQAGGVATDWTGAVIRVLVVGK